MELNTILSFPVTKSLFTVTSSVNSSVISRLNCNAISNYPALKLKYVGKRVREHRVPPLKAVAGCTFSSDDIVVKSPHDRSLYRYIKLQNGLCALLVHDPRLCENQHEDAQSKHTELRAAAAMCVGFGQFDDPHEARRLANLLEHMLFMGGTEEFPIENEFDSYLCKHGGYSSAYSTTEYTCYSFQVKNDFLKGALTRFSQMFISPLMKAVTIERAVRAVDSEFHGRLHDDRFHLEQLQCHTSLPNHPYNRFLLGNMKSLMVEPMEKGVNFRDQILTFFHENYNASSMKLVVVGGVALDELETCVLELFSHIKKGPQAKPKTSLATPIWEPDKLFKLQAVKDHHILELSWTLPSLRKDYMKKAEDYLAHLFKHKGRGSLHYFLKGRGLVTSISAGVNDDGFKLSSFAHVFGMTIYLTESGLEKMYETIGFVYQYIKLLQQTAPPEWIYKEFQCDANLSFLYPNKRMSTRYAGKLAENMLSYPAEQAVYGDYDYELDAQMINQMLDYFRPDNMRIDVMSKSFDKLGNFQHEPWFGSQYVEDNIPSLLVDLWKNPPEIDASLYLPAKNELSPLGFFIYDNESPCSILDKSSPRFMLDVPLVELRYKLDKDIAHPRGNTDFQITLKGEYHRLEDVMLTKLFVLLLKDELDDIVNQARVSKLETSVSFFEDKLELKVFDFKDELTILLFKILKLLKTYVPKESRFQVIKEDLERTLRNTNVEPSDHLDYLRLQVLCEGFWDVEDKLSLLKDLNLGDLSSRFIRGTRLQIFIEGNLLDYETFSMSDIFQNNSSAEPYYFARWAAYAFVMNLPPGADLVRDARVENNLVTTSFIEIYFQIGPDEEGMDFMKPWELIYVFCDIIDPHSIISSDDLNSILGLRFRVESSHYHPAYLQERINNFINSFDLIIQELDDEAFENDQGIEKNDIIKFYRTYIQKSSPQRRTLTTRLWGCNTDWKELVVVESESSTKIIDDLQAFKKSSEFYPTYDRF